MRSNTVHVLSLYLSEASSFCISLNSKVSLLNSFLIFSTNCFEALLNYLQITKANEVRVHCYIKSDVILCEISFFLKCARVLLLSIEVKLMSLNLHLAARILSI